MEPTAEWRACWHGVTWVSSVWGSNPGRVGTFPRFIGDGYVAARDTVHLAPPLKRHSPCCLGRHMGIVPGRDADDRTFKSRPGSIFLSVFSCVFLASVAVVGRDIGTSGQWQSTGSEWPSGLRRLRLIASVWERLPPEAGGPRLFSLLRSLLRRGENTYKTFAAMNHIVAP